MANETELFTSAIEHWRLSKGVGTALIPPPLNDKTMLIMLLQRLYLKSPTVTTLIIVSNFGVRERVIEFLTHQEDETNNAEFKHLLDDKYIRIFTTGFVDNENFKMNPFATVLYGCENISYKCLDIIAKSKFKLAIANRIPIIVDDWHKLLELCPLLDDFKQSELDELRCSTPVEEMRVGISIPDDTEPYKLLEYYNSYISLSIGIFGSLENIDNARVGDKKTGMSSMAVCDQIARYNGWNEHLDMNIPINVELDNLYNPNAIKDRASMTYEVIRNRSLLLADYDGKLDKIHEIVESNKDKKILIISKRSEFAAKITDYLNNLSETTICGNYHRSVDPIPAVDLDGNPIYIKSGISKGKRRTIKGDAQKTYNVERFNAGLINVISTNNAPDATLHIPVDVVIITSPQCKSLKSYLYRLNKIWFPNNSIKLYSLYIKNSVEEKQLADKDVGINHTIVEDTIAVSEENVKIDENCDFIIVN